MSCIDISNTNMYAMYADKTGLEREMAILDASWTALFGSVPIVNDVAVLMMPVFQLFVFTPWLLLFFFGKWITGYGGSDMYEICAKTSGHPASFWLHDEVSQERCRQAVMTEFASYATTILVPIYFILLAILSANIIRVSRRFLRKCLPRRLKDFWDDTPKKTCTDCKH